MSITSWFLRQLRLNSFDIDSGNGLVATEKFKKIKIFNVFNGNTESFSKNKRRLLYLEALSTYPNYSNSK